MTNEQRKMMKKYIETYAPNSNELYSYPVVINGKTYFKHSKIWWKRKVVHPESDYDRAMGVIGKH